MSKKYRIETKEDFVDGLIRAAFLGATFGIVGGKEIKTTKLIDTETGKEYPLDSDAFKQAVEDQGVDTEEDEDVDDEDEDEDEE